MEALGKHIEDGHTHYVYRIVPCVDLTASDDKDDLGIVISKRYSEVLELAASAELKELCRDRDAAADLGLFRKCNVDSAKDLLPLARPTAAGTYPACCSVAGAILLMQTPCGCWIHLRQQEGDCVFGCQMSLKTSVTAMHCILLNLSASNCRILSQRPAEVNCGRAVQFRHADVLHHVVAPASTAVVKPSQPSLQMIRFLLVDNQEI